MRKRVLTLLILMLAVASTALAEDLLRVCSAYYPGGCALHIYDYGGSFYDFHALWCGSDLIYEAGGLGGAIDSRGNCIYFL